MASEITVRSEVNRPPLSERPITAAFDFGTSSSGYAFAFMEDTSMIHTNSWQMNKDVVSTTAKAPTSVLLTPDQTFHSFGYDAEEKYAELCNDEDQTGWYFFQRFKTLLYRTTLRYLDISIVADLDNCHQSQNVFISVSSEHVALHVHDISCSMDTINNHKLTREAEIHDVEGKPMAAIEVFSIVIRELEERLMADIRSQKGDVSHDDILYVLTVPAIWSDAAKQFMREAAIKVGIKSDQLRLALEPEAASVYCRQYPSRRTEKDGKVTYEPFVVGHRYIVADLGGGTVDIATHEVVTGNRLHEIHNAIGENIGSLRFDEEFLKFLKQIFDPDLFDTWRQNEPGDFMQLQRSIEGVKWSLAGVKNKAVSVSEYTYLNIPYTLQCFHMQSGNNIEEAIAQNGYHQKVKVVRGKAKVKLSTEFVKGFFSESINGITAEIRSILNTVGANSDGLETIVIVGGLGKSEYVKDCIQSAFPDRRILVPSESGLAVLRGAVLLGNCPEIIAGRIARYTYGINVVEPFKVGVHREEYIFYRDGEVFCRNVLKKLIQKGQVMKYGQVFETMGAITPRDGERRKKIYKTFLYQSTEPDTLYHTDDSCTKIGGFLLDPPDEGWPDYCDCKIQIIVGEAEFQFIVEILGKRYDGTVDFLMKQ